MDVMSDDPLPSTPVDTIDWSVRGDEQRDQGDWAGAADAYARHLRDHAEDWRIWVQYGHALKECGDPRAALLCYREAERYAPEDSDLQVQIGHALKLTGRAEEAFGAYARALSLDPENSAARRELLQVEDEWSTAPEAAEAAEEAVSGAFIFDASDLLDYVRNNRAPTGIQRVQFNIIRAALHGRLADQVVVVGFDLDSGTWKPVDRELFLRLAELSRSGAAADAADWTEAVAATQTQLRQGAPLEFAPGSALINLGTSWWIPDYLLRVRVAKARYHIRYIPFLHDCIPLLLPEHCAMPLVDDFARWFAGVCVHADAILTNSRCSARDFERLSAQLLPDQSLPVTVIPLDAAPDRADLTPLPLPPRLRDRPFVLCVGTIESRKDHLLIFDSWLTLVRTHGEDRVPDLVCVGKRGWLAEATFARHAHSPILRRKVHLLHDVPDTMLTALYDGCLFTLYNSYYEGWGLPVTESLAHGKVVLLPDHSSLPEAGGAGAVFFQRQGGTCLADQAWRLIDEPGFRAAAEARLRSQLRLRSWAELADQMLAAVRAGGPVQPAPLERLRPMPGVIHPVRLLPGPDALPAMAIADALRDGPGWSRLEEACAWASIGDAAMRLPWNGGGSAMIRVHLELLAPPDQAASCVVRVGQDGQAESVTQMVALPPGGRMIASLSLRAAGTGDLRITFLPSPDGMAGIGAVRIGVCNVMACEEGDVQARLAYLEACALRVPAG